MMKLVIFLIFGFYTILFGNGLDDNICISKDNYKICPNKNSEILDTLALFKKNSSNKQKTQISFDNIQIINSLVKFFIVSNFDGYMSIIHIDSKGKKEQFFPNENIPDSYVNKGQLIDLSYDKDKLSLSDGLGYFIVIISDKRVYFNSHTKGTIYNAFSDEKIFKQILQDIYSNKYGKYSLNLLPYFTLKDEK